MARKLDRALVLEDDPIARRLAVIILQGMGFTRVLEATDGHAALQVLDAGTGQDNTACDLALCDLNMAGMDGVEFLRRLGDSDRVAAVIVTSAMEPAVLRAVETMAQDSGINLLGSIPKPISRAAIETLLAQQTDTPPAASPGGNDDRRPPLMDADQLRQGLREGRLLALYQPKVALLDRQLRGAEALATEAAQRLERPLTPEDLRWIWGQFRERYQSLVRQQGLLLLCRECYNLLIPLIIYCIPTMPDRAGPAP